MKIKVGFRTYTLQRVTPILGDDKNYGSTDHDNALIVITQEITGADYVDTLLHELLHCCWDVYAIAEISKRGEEEEAAVRMSATALTIIFVDNMWLIDHIRDELRQ